MDLKHSNSKGTEITVVGDAYMQGSKSSDLIKPNDSSPNLANQQPGELSNII